MHLEAELRHFQTIYVIKSYIKGFNICNDSILYQKVNKICSPEILLYCTDTVLYCTVLYCTVLYCTVWQAWQCPLSCHWLEIILIECAPVVSPWLEGKVHHHLLLLLLHYIRYIKLMIIKKLVPVVIRWLFELNLYRPVLFDQLLIYLYDRTK